MKLFYASGASSLAPHILLEESEMVYQLERVNLDTKKFQDTDYNLINPKSYVPALEIEHGNILTECAVILEFIARTSPDKSFMGAYGSQDYWEQRMWLNYIATELHKNFISPFRNGNWLPNTVESKQLVYQRVLPRLKLINQKLANQSWLVNNQFSAPDAYLFVITNWLQRLEYGFDGLENLSLFDHRMRNRHAVQNILRQEGKPHSLKDDKA